MIFYANNLSLQSFDFAKAFVIFKRAIVLIIIFGTVFFCQLASANQPLEASQELYNFLNSIKTMHASFSQQVHSQGNILQESKGVMDLKRPNKIYWQVEAPDKSVIVSDGKKIWNFDEDLEQVTISRVQGNIDDTPLGMIFQDHAKLTKSFTIDRVSKQEHPCYQHAKMCFSLLPKQESVDQNFRKIVIGFSGEQISVINLLDQLGQVTTVQFSNININPDIPDNKFKFVPPPNIDIIGN